VQEEPEPAAEIQADTQTGSQSESTTEAEATTATEEAAQEEESEQAATERPRRAIGGIGGVDSTADDESAA
jgi:hypothetical protein